MCSTTSGQPPLLRAVGLSKHFPLEAGLLASLRGAKSAVRAVEGVSLNVSAVPWGAFCCACCNQAPAVQDRALACDPWSANPARVRVTTPGVNDAFCLTSSLMLAATQDRLECGGQRSSYVFGLYKGENIFNMNRTRQMITQGFPPASAELILLYEEDKSQKEIPTLQLNPSDESSPASAD